MTRPFRHILWLTVGLGASTSLLLPSLAQSQPQPEPKKSATAVPDPLRIPEPPLKSPIDLFRQLLAMNNAEREKHLSARPPENRKRIEEKLQEYQAMKPEERELRLRATQLRWHLVRLMQMPAVNRMAQLSMIPDAADRQFLEYRLQLWDDLSSAQQKDVLQYENAVHFLGHGSESRTNEINTFPQAQREELIRKVKQWESLPAGQREKMSAQFQQFFELTENEKQKALQTLPEAERQQMEKTLRSFAHLPKERREKCVHAFNKFASMSDEERQQFLKNAERWEKMTPSERESWRNLVSRLPEMPPSPPGLGVPPMPKVARKVSAPPLPLVTNHAP